MKKLIINFAPTGIKPTKKLNPYVPISIDEISNDVYENYKKGVQIVHIHVRDENGENTSDQYTYEKLIIKIRKMCPEIIICASLSGRKINTFESRSQVLDLKGLGKPDMGSLTLSSLNFTDGTSVNTPEMIISLLNKMNENNIKPELEVFDVGMINYSKYLIKKGLLKPPYYYNIICGNISSAQANIQDIFSMINSLPDNSIYSLGGFGHDQLKMNMYGLLNADGIRIGLEDNLYFDESKKLASNGMLIDRILEISKLYGRELASYQEVRDLLNIKNINNQIIKWICDKNVDNQFVNSKINECVKTNIFSNFGNNVENLQEYLKQLLKIDNNKCVIMTTNGSCALLTLVLLYDKIYNKKLKYAVQSFTFPCSHQSLLSDSLIFDIDENMGPDINLLEKHKNEYDGIIITNCFGNCVNINLYENFCKKNNKILIFDNASTPYTFYNNKNILNYGDSCFISLHHTKQIGFGEGGAIIIDNKYKDEIEKIISFGYTKTNRTDYSLYASNFKMSEISSIYILQWLNNFETILSKNLTLNKYIKDNMSNISQIDFFNNFSDIEHNNLMTCIPILFRTNITTNLFDSNNIQAKKYYYPLDVNNKNAMDLYNKIICLPLHKDITIEDIDKYIEVITKSFT